MAKNRIAPLKKITLPRLELMAAVIGARLATHIQKSLDVSTLQLWSDSQIVLHWIKSTKSLKRFVENRVQEIRALTDSNKWNYCPTGENPADLLTRGSSVEKFYSNTLWWNGPSWLSERLKWPHCDINIQMTSVAADDISVTVSTADDSTTSGSERNERQGIHTILDASAYSTYNKLLRVTAYLIIFVTNCRINRTMRDFGPLTAKELGHADLMWIFDTQSNTYTTEKDSIKSKSSKLLLVRQLRLFLDKEDVIRCGGRIHNAPISEDAKFPYLLPRNHAITRLIIYDAHVDQLHAGVKTTITHLRQKFWADGKINHSQICDLP